MKPVKLIIILIILALLALVLTLVFYKADKGGLSRATLEAAKIQLNISREAPAALSGKWELIK